MTPELYPTADQRERCGRCGEWDEDHAEICRHCDESQDGCCCASPRWVPFVLCRDGKGEFTRETRPSHDD